MAFNILGSYTYTNNYIKRITDDFNQRMPMGYKCRNSSYGFYQDNGTQYGLLVLVIVIIFFVCCILFESLRLPKRQLAESLRPRLQSQDYGCFPNHRVYSTRSYSFPH